MARIRTVKPEFWKDAKLLKVSRDARLLFIATLNFADDEGRLVYDVEQLKIDIFPQDDVDIGAIYQELADIRRVAIYEVAGKSYLHVVNFSKHQKVDKRTASRLPPPPPDPSDSPRIPPTAADHSASVDAPRVDPPTEGKGSRKGTGEDKSLPAKKTHGTPEDHAMARRMFEAVRVVAPTAKEPLWDAWANAIRLMREQDERTHAQIWEQFEWANRDSFWRVNVLSPGTLRDRWNQLEAKRVSGRSGTGATNSPPRDYGQPGKI